MDIKVKRWCVYLVDLGKQCGSIQFGVRPCIIVSNNESCLYSPVVIGVPCTSQRKTTLPTHLNIDTDKYNFLWRKSNTCLCEQPTPIAKEQIIQYLGKLDDDDVKEVEKRLKITFSL